MAEISRTAAEVTALVGTRTGNLTLFAEDIDPHYTQEDRWKNRVTDLLALLAGLEVFKDGDLTFGVRAGKFEAAGATVTYAGATAQALTDNDTNYIYLTAAGALTVNLTGFPATDIVQLATILTAGSTYAIADITDYRQAFMWAAHGSTLLRSYPIHASELRNDDWTVMDATGGAGLFSLAFGGFGTGTLTIDAEAASANTKTDTLWFEFTLPINYIASATVQFSVKAIETNEAQVSSTISGEVYESDGEGGVSADLFSAWDVTDITTAWGAKVMTITDAGLVAGDTIRVGIRVVTDDTAGAGAQVKLDSPKMLVDVYAEF